MEIRIQYMGCTGLMPDACHFLSTVQPMDPDGNLYGVGLLVQCTPVLLLVHLKSIRTNRSPKVYEGQRWYVRQLGYYF